MSKIFPFTGEGSLNKKIFSSLNMYQAKSGVKNFPFTRGGVPRQKIFFSSLNIYQAKSGVKKFSPLLRPGLPPPPPPVQGWISLSENLRPENPPLDVNRQTPVKTVPSRRTTYAGGNKAKLTDHNIYGRQARQRRIMRRRMMARPEIPCLPANIRLKVLIT